MNKLILTVLTTGLVALGNCYGQVITTGGSVLGRPLAITGRTSVRFDQLPPNVQQVIRSQASGGVVANVTAGTYSGRAYRVTLNQNGGQQTLQFTANGAQLSGDGGLITAPLNNARPITFQQLPANIQDAVAAQAQAGAVTSVMQGTFDAPVYDALVQAPGQSPRHLIVTQSGGLLQPIAVNEAAGANNNAPPIPEVNASDTANIPVGQPVAGNLAFKDLGWSVQRPMLDRSHYAHIDTVEQLKLPDGRIAYRGLYDRNNQQYQVTVAQDGTVISEGLLSNGVAQ
jgi:hypothetical protein